MKVLWVKAGGLVPPDFGGRIRSYNILKELARQHAVTFFTFYAAEPNDQHPQLEALFARAVYLPLPLPAPKSLGEFGLYLRHLLSPLPYNVAKYCPPAVGRALQRLTESEHYDVIVCDFLAPAAILPWELPCPKVVFTHNVEALIWRRHYQVARNPVWKAVCWRESRAMESFERRTLERADHVLTVSDHDRDFFARFLDPAKITVIPTGVDLDYFQPGAEAEEPNALVFTGSMDWMPNEDAVFYFVRDILPRIRRHRPDTTFWVVGRRPSSQLQALAATYDGLRVTGTVDDIRPFMRRATVFVVPLRVGSGTRLKIFEAMAMGKAVVSTPMGAEGLPVKDGGHLLLAEEPESFANRVVALLGDANQRRQLGRAARALVEREYGWAAVARHFDAVLAQVTKKAGGA